jgi:SAM-dependent methyltransferase
MTVLERGKRLVRRLQGRVPLPDRYQALIDTYAPGRRFLDVGCLWKVHGAYAFRAAERGATEVIGLDVTPATPQFLAENDRRGAPVRFLQGDVNDPALTATIGRCDVVFCSGVLYHVPNPVWTIERLRDLCGGTLILSTATVPEQAIPQSAVFFPHLAARARGALRYATGDVKIGLDTAYDGEAGYANWFWGFTPSCVDAMVRVAGFEVRQRFAYRRALCLVCE